MQQEKKEEYSIREVSELFHIPASTLRYYEEEGILVNVRKNASGQRVYERGHINRLSTIFCFKRTGMKIAQLKDFFAYEEDEAGHIDDILKLLEGQRDYVTKQMEQLQKDYAHVGRKLRYYEAIKQALMEGKPRPSWDDYREKKGTLEKLTPDAFEAVWEIMEESFPITERRIYEDQKKLLSNSHYELYGCKNKGEIALFFAVWKVENFNFIEHFAVSKRFRNGGLGSAMLKELMKHLEGTVILEVEPPEEELPKRRIGFYERNGFVLNEYPYLQPPLTKGCEAIPLLIMSSGRALTKEEYGTVRSALYKKVYQVNENFPIDALQTEC